MLIRAKNGSLQISRPNLRSIVLSSSRSHPEFHGSAYKSRLNTAATSVRTSIKTIAAIFKKNSFALRKLFLEESLPNIAADLQSASGEASALRNIAKDFSPKDILFIASLPRSDTQAIALRLLVPNLPENARFDLGLKMAQETRSIYDGVMRDLYTGQLSLDEISEIYSGRIATITNVRYHLACGDGTHIDNILDRVKGSIGNSLAIITGALSGSDDPKGDAIFYASSPTRKFKTGNGIECEVPYCHPALREIAEALLGFLMARGTTQDWDRGRSNLEIKGREIPSVESGTHHKTFDGLKWPQEIALPKVNSLIKLLGWTINNYNIGSKGRCSFSINFNSSEYELNGIGLYHPVTKEVVPYYSLSIYKLTEITKNTRRHLLNRVTDRMSAARQKMTAELAREIEEDSETRWVLEAIQAMHKCSEQHLGSSIYDILNHRLPHAVITDYYAMPGFYRMGIPIPAGIKFDTRNNLLACIIARSIDLNSDAGTNRKNITLSNNSSAINNKGLYPCDDIEEIIYELIRNAIKYSQRNISISHFDTEAATIVTVENDGPGIEPNFDPFARGVRGNNVGNIMGTGNGLTTVREDAERNGLTVNFISTPGKTVFYLTIPHATTEAAV